MTDETATTEAAPPADPFAGVENPANDLEHDLDQDPTGEQGEPQGEQLFDGDRFLDPDLILDSHDGRNVDEIRLPFSGTIVLNRHSKADVAFFKGLHQGRRYDLEAVEVTVVAAEKSSYDKDGDEKTLAAVKSLRVTGLTVTEQPDEAAA